MKSSVSGTWLFSLVMGFTLIFSGFLVLALSYSKAYKIKNEMLTMIEKYEGLTEDADGKTAWGSVTIINNYLKQAGYHATNTCKEEEQYDVYGAESLDDTKLKLVTNFSKKYYYCVTYINKDKASCKSGGSITVDDVGKFRVEVFFDFNLPVVGKVSTYTIKGITKNVHYAKCSAVERS